MKQITLCDQALSALSEYGQCSLLEGSARVRTHCLYPSFEPVDVVVESAPNGSFRVHDDGNAFAIAWDHGRDERAVTKALELEALRFQIELQGISLSSHASTPEWLQSSILAVANASAHAAMSVVRKSVIAVEVVLKERIGSILRKEVAPRFEVQPEFQLHGLSGKQHKFDFAVRTEDTLLLIDAVAPHHSSISHRFVAFSDARRAAPDKTQGFAVFDKPLDPDDASLIGQVADLVPFSGLGRGAIRAMSR